MELLPLTGQPVVLHDNELATLESANFSLSLLLHENEDFAAPIGCDRMQARFQVLLQDCSRCLSFGEPVVLERPLKQRLTRAPENWSPRLARAGGGSGRQVGGHGVVRGGGG